MLFKKLSPKQEDKFRKWARDNYGIGSPINDLWHPIVREECNKMNAEKRTTLDQPDEDYDSPSGFYRRGGKLYFRI